MKTILVIEDTDFIRENISTTLKFEGYNAVLAQDGIEGLEAIEEYKPDLILCDVSMPRLDGFGVLTELRKKKDTETIPFIFLTAKAEKAAMRRGMELGSDDYLSKPFTTDELIAAVHTQLAKKEQVAQHYEKKMEGLRGSLTYALPHEFRTALNGILGFADIIINVTGSEESAADLNLPELNEMATAIKESGRRLHKLTEKILKYTEVQTLAHHRDRALELRRSVLPNAKETIDEIGRSIAMEYQRIDDLNVQSDNAALCITTKHFYEIVYELFDNAFKFSPENTPVEVRAKIENGRYLVSISDKGRGMSDDNIRNIGAYTQFQRDIYEQQGAGLGLIIAKMLLELYGGSLAIRSEEGKGLCATLELPIADITD